MVLHVTVIGATNLERKHSDPCYSSDPFVVVSLDHKQFANGDDHFRTSVQKNTLNPQFNETFQFTLPKNASFDSIDVIFEVFDWKVIGKNASMGQAQTNLSILRKQLKTVQCECSMSSSSSNVSSSSRSSLNGSVNNMLGKCLCMTTTTATNNGVIQMTSDTHPQQPCEKVDSTASNNSHLTSNDDLSSSSTSTLVDNSNDLPSSSSLDQNHINSSNCQLSNTSSTSTSSENTTNHLSERKCTCHHRKIYKPEPQRLKLELIGYMHKGNSFIEVELMADESDFKKCH